MYQPIRMDSVATVQRFTECTTLNPFQQDSSYDYLSEAVFRGGRSKVKKMEEQWGVVKNLLEEQIKAQDDTTAQRQKEGKKSTTEIKAFDPKAFWRHTELKKLEDTIKDIFGFRHVSIEPFIERYNSRSKEFETKIMNCFVRTANRFPIDGLVTDDGFYDKSHSLVMNIYASLGLIKHLSPPQLTAVLLHEFGHGIDPAVMSIRYTETNVLSKYLTDRKSEITKGEKKVVYTISSRKTYLFIICVCIVCGITFICEFADKIAKKISELFHGGYNEKAMERRIREQVKKDQSKFDRRSASEAYADNFARMYGYGPELMQGLKVIVSKEVHEKLRGRYKKEQQRAKIIAEITKNTIQDVHKTDIHRIHALLKEYDEDINDPNTPADVKKQLRDDKKELELVLDSYLNDFDAFQNRINRAIMEELQLQDAAEEKSKEAKPKETKPKEEKSKESNKQEEPNKPKEKAALRK